MAPSYENYWMRKQREQKERRAQLRKAAAAQPAPAPTECRCLTKKGDPCKGAPNGDGLCVGHQNAADAGKELTFK